MPLTRKEQLLYHSLGQVVMWLAAWWQQGWAVGVGLATIAAGWTWSLPRWRRQAGQDR